MELMIRHSVPGVHAWPEAPDTVPEYLRHPHRHTFSFLLRLAVTKEERQVEFHAAQNVLRMVLRAIYPCYSAARWSADGVTDFGRRSCETIGRETIKAFRDRRLGDIVSLEVWEDDECGALVLASEVPA